VRVIGWIDSRTKINAKHPITGPERYEKVEWKLLVMLRVIDGTNSKEMFKKADRENGYRVRVIG